MTNLAEDETLSLSESYATDGIGFEGHEFFEASSMRKINGKYYLVYSSVESQELCYCVSDKQDRDFTDDSDTDSWYSFHGEVNMSNGVETLYFEYHGARAVDFLEFTLY